jgi:hypothetical protein
MYSLPLLLQHIQHKCASVSCGCTGEWIASCSGERSPRRLRQWGPYWSDTTAQKIGHLATHLHEVIKVGYLPIDPLVREASGPQKVRWSSAAVVTEIGGPKAQDPSEDLVTCLQEHAIHFGISF